MPLALERLKGFRFVGLTDDWERSVCLLHVMHDRQPCAPAEMVNTRPTSTASRDAKRLATLLLETFMDTADSAVYAAARSRFHDDTAQWGVTASLCRVLKCTSNSWPRGGAQCGQADGI